MRRNQILSWVLMLVCMSAMAATPKKPSTDTPQGMAKVDQWKSFRFLIGNWTGDGTGPAGQGIGDLVVETDLKDSILKMTNQVDFTGKDKKTTYRSTMVVSGGSKALFMDNEGHVLHYTVTLGPKTVTFVSDPEPNSPRFRFTYTDLGSNKVRCSFDIAPPPNLNKYTIHESGTATNK
jgi:hypothetical protein